jgi:hypothetical protein
MLNRTRADSHYTKSHKVSPPSHHVTTHFRLLRTQGHALSKSCIPVSKTCSQKIIKTTKPSVTRACIKAKVRNRDLPINKARVISTQFSVRFYPHHGTESKCSEGLLYVSCLLERCIHTKYFLARATYQHAAINDYTFWYCF